MIIIYNCVIGTKDTGGKGGESHLSRRGGLQKAEPAEESRICK